MRRWTDNEISAWHLWDYLDPTNVFNSVHGFNKGEYERFRERMGGSMHGITMYQMEQFSQTEFAENVTVLDVHGNPIGEQVDVHICRPNPLYVNSLNFKTEKFVELMKSKGIKI